MKTIAERLLAARERKEWTQSQLAVAADVSQGTIGNIESGLRQSKGSLPQIAEALGVSHKWLATGQGTMDMAPQPKPEDLQDPLGFMVAQYKYLLEHLPTHLRKTAHQEVLDVLSMHVLQSERQAKRGSNQAGKR